MVDRPAWTFSYWLTIRARFGEVVAAYADSRVYSNNRWHFGNDPALRTCHYVAGGTFFVTGDAFEVESAQRSAAT